MKKILLFALLLPFISIFITSCSDDEADANDSIQGNWSIVKAERAMQDDYTEENIGYMNFSSETVEYNFTLIDSSYAGTTDWELTTEMVNSGFHTVPKYTLTLGEVWKFDILFGDGTDDSAEDAREMMLTELDQDYDYYVLYLEKR